MVVEEDDLTVTVAPGTKCKRQGCFVTFVSDAENRQGDGPGTVCAHHPRPVRDPPFLLRTITDTITQPIFHEGSKVTRHFTESCCVFIHGSRMMSGLSLLQASRVRIRRVPKNRGLYAWPPPVRSQTQAVNGACDPPTSLAALVPKL